MLGSLRCESCTDDISREDNILGPEVFEMVLDADGKVDLLMVRKSDREISRRGVAIEAERWEDGKRIPGEQ